MFFLATRQSELEAPNTYPLPRDSNTSQMSFYSTATRHSLDAAFRLVVLSDVSSNHERPAAIDFDMSLHFLNFHAQVGNVPNTHIARLSGLLNLIRA
jgi:hypothetical protein